MTGYEQAGSEWLDQILSEDMRYFSSKEESVDIEVSGKQARLLGRNRVDARIYGMRHTWPLKIAFDLEKQDGKWVFHHAVATTY